MGMKVLCNFNGLQIALNINHSSYIIQDLVDILVVKIGAQESRLYWAKQEKGFTRL
jgi:hypothetical protein